jgi:hypothetical protein
MVARFDADARRCMVDSLNDSTTAFSGAMCSAGMLYITKQSGPDFSGYLIWKNLDTGESGKGKFAG